MALGLRNTKNRISLSCTAPQALVLPGVFLLSISNVYSDLHSLDQLKQRKPTSSTCPNSYNCRLQMIITWTLLMEKSDCLVSFTRMGHFSVTNLLPLSVYRFMQNPAWDMTVSGMKDYGISAFISPLISSLLKAVSQTLRTLRNSKENLC